MTGRRVLAAAGALAVAAGAAGAWAGASLPGSGPARASRPTVAVGTAVVQRRDLAVTDLVNGTLGYRASAPVVNRLAGTYTALPAEGSVVGRGQALYQVDGSPVVLMYGRQPAWRAFAPGIPDGPDVAELEANLAALGFTRGLFGTPDAHFDWATRAAVERWQRAVDLARTGTGRVVFLAGAVRVGAHQVAAVPGHPAATGRLDQEPVQVELASDTHRGVLAVPITALLALAEGGYGLEVVEPSGAHRLVAVHTGLFASTMVEVGGAGVVEGAKVVTAR
jgi:hypothetical protein